MISKTATIVRQGLKIHNVQDPLSCCFATSRPIIKDIHIEGKGDELLLEKLVKSNRNRKNNMIPVKEIPFSGEGEQTTKLDLDRILSYSKAVWHLYRYGEKSNRIQNEPEIVEQKQHNGSVSLKSSFKY